VNSRAEIVAAIQKASSLAEQAALVTELDQYDRNQRRAAAEARSIDLADTIVQETLRPVAVHEMHTTSTDWLGSFEAAEDSDNQLLATAALWYSRVSPEVKADQEEFMEQAKGIMRREASAYGERAQAAYSAGMTYLAHLVRREAASGLDQIDQTVAPDGVTSAPTPIPTDVFDNFAPEVHPDNQGVVGTETSERNPLLQQIQSEDGGQGQPEWGHGTWDESWGRTGDDAAPAEQATADDVGDDEYNQFQASVAIGHLYNMDQFRAEAASGLDQIQQTVAPDGVTDKSTPLPDDVMFPWILGDENPQAQDTAPAQAAIEQAKQAALDDLGGKCPSCDTPVAGTGKVKCGDCGLNFERQEKQQSGQEHKVGSRRADPNARRVVKEADMFGNSDTPHAVPQPNVANNPATTPRPEDSAASGKEDASIGNASTTADGTEYPKYSEGFSEGIADLHESDKHSVPSAMGGDNGTGLGNPKEAKAKCRNCTNGNQTGTNGTPGCIGKNCGCSYEKCGKEARPDTGGLSEESYAAKAHLYGRQTAMDEQAKQSSLTPKTSALFVTVAAADNRDFKRAYAYSSKWTPGTPLVKQGSAEFETGLYAGISDNPAHQSAWVQAHRKWAAKGNEDLERRVELHEAFTQKVATKLERETEGAYLKVEAMEGDDSGGPCKACGQNTDDEGVCMNTKCSHFSRFSGKPNTPWPGQTVMSSKEAATTTDLDTLDPSASPATDGSTPINGIGQPGPLDGKQDAAAPGGAAPYNGAEPFGQAAVPTGKVRGSGDPKDLLVNDIPGGPLDGNARAYAFRRQVQANLVDYLNPQS